MLCVKLFVKRIKNELIFIHHHLVDDIILKRRRSGRNLDPLLLGVQFFLGQSFLIMVVHLSQGDGRIRSDNQRFDPLLVVRWIFDLVAESQLPLGAFPQTIG